MRTPSTTIRRTIAVVATALAGLALAAAPAAASDLDTRAGVTTPAEYIEYLRGSNEPGAGQTLADFSALPAADQQRFIDHLNDPSLFKAFMEEVGTIEPETTRGTSRTVTEIGEDVEIISETTVEPVSGLAGPGINLVGAYRTTYSVSQKFLGVTITKLSTWIHYYTNGSAVTTVYSSGAGVVNYNGAVSIDDNVLTPWISGGLGYAETVFKGYFLFKGFNIRIDKLQQCVVYWDGFYSGFLRNI